MTRVTFENAHWLTQRANMAHNCYIRIYQQKGKLATYYDDEGNRDYMGRKNPPVIVDTLTSTISQFKLRRTDYNQTWFIPLKCTVKIIGCWHYIGHISMTSSMEQQLGVILKDRSGLMRIENGRLIFPDPDPIDDSQDDQDLMCDLKESIKEQITKQSNELIDKELIDIIDVEIISDISVISEEDLEEESSDEESEDEELPS